MKIEDLFNCHKVDDLNTCKFNYLNYLTDEDKLSEYISENRTLKIKTITNEELDSVELDKSTWLDKEINKIKSRENNNIRELSIKCFSKQINLDNKPESKNLILDKMIQELVSESQKINKYGDLNLSKNMDHASIYRHVVSGIMLHNSFINSSLRRGPATNVLFGLETYSYVSCFEDIGAKLNMKIDVCPSIPDDMVIVWRKGNIDEVGLHYFENSKGDWNYIKVGDNFCSSFRVIL